MYVYIYISLSIYIYIYICMLSPPQKNNYLFSIYTFPESSPAINS